MMRLKPPKKRFLKRLELGISSLAGSRLAPIVMDDGTVAFSVFQTTSLLPPKKTPSSLVDFLDIQKRHQHRFFAGKQSTYMNIELMEEFLPCQPKAYR